MKTVARCCCAGLPLVPRTPGGAVDAALSEGCPRHARGALTWGTMALLSLERGTLSGRTRGVAALRSADADAERAERSRAGGDAVDVFDFAADQADGVGAVVDGGPAAGGGHLVGRAEAPAAEGFDGFEGGAARAGLAVEGAEDADVGGVDR